MKVKVEKAPIYTYLFDKKSGAWMRDEAINRFFLMAQQAYSNELLMQRGYLFLNEVFDMLGMARTKAGQIVGWLYDAKNPIGDNFVDFGLCRDDPPKGINGAIVLNFNVDGNILKV